MSSPTDELFDSFTSERKILGFNTPHTQFIPRGPIIQPSITFAMIKNDAIYNGVDKQILQMIRGHGFSVLAFGNDLLMSPKQILAFYHDHADRPYFQDLYNSVAWSALPMILEVHDDEPAVWGEHRIDAIATFRSLIGATDARKAEPGTIRHAFGGHLFDPAAPLAQNAIHGSDSFANVLREIGIVFPDIRALHSTRHGQFFLDELVDLSK